MKLIASFFALAALTQVGVGSAFAQEESPSPSTTTEEKASATVETTSESTPAEKASATPAAEKSASPAAKKSASPATEKAASPGKKMSVEATLKDMENRWEAAIGKHDTATVESMVADDFIGVSSKSKVQNRRGLLAEMKGDKDTRTLAKNEKLDVHNYGAGVAVVVGTSREKGTGKDGKAFDKTYRFTDTWMERNGQWKCIASHVALVSQK